MQGSHRSKQWQSPTVRNGRLEARIMPPSVGRSDEDIAGDPTEFELLKQELTIKQLRFLKMANYLANCNYWMAISFIENEYDYRLWSKRALKSWNLLVKMVKRLS
jgi:hypothetical protein